MDGIMVFKEYEAPSLFLCLFLCPSPPHIYITLIRALGTLIGVFHPLDFINPLDLSMLIT